jgi:ABC-type nitrate/sulfonate/bicarbonate transport system substrate-binding protein
MSHRVRNVLVALTIIVVLTGLGYFLYQRGQSTDTSGVFPGKLKAGHLVALDMAPLFVAKEAGYFADEGLDVDTVFFANPGDNNAALTGGSIHFSTNPFTLPFLGENSGVPMRIVSSAGGLGIMQVIVQGSLGISNLDDLVKYVKDHPGKKLKVATLKGDTLEMILYRAFKSKGLSYDDFDMVWFNDLHAMVDSFRSKQTDILSTSNPIRRSSS